MQVLLLGFCYLSWNWNVSVFYLPMSYLCVYYAGFHRLIMSLQKVRIRIDIYLFSISSHQ